ncbi:UNVERIFIED_CONTAM: dodecenoyl-CoA isomerase [Siphonaria sp. JEL0065]|nr:dodecenoyl-CoA isomerase [Siphonaria sp. JEL0065]
MLHRISTAREFDPADTVNLLYSFPKILPVTSFIGFWVFGVFSLTQTKGLNEPQIGLMVPVIWMELYATTIGQRQAKLLGCNGSVATSMEAKRIGLVDLLVPKEQLLQPAKGVMAKFLKMPSFGRSLTKQMVCQRFSANLGNLDTLKEQSQAGWEFLTAKPTL